MHNESLSELKPQDQNSDEVQDSEVEKRPSMVKTLIQDKDVLLTYVSITLGALLFWQFTENSKKTEVILELVRQKQALEDELQK
jgi:hypothetical protein